MLAEALEIVAKKYIPGVIDFYGKMDPDPWLQALETFANELSDPKSGQRYIDTCERLISAYKIIHPDPIKQLNIRDAFAIGNEERVVQMNKDPLECKACGSPHGTRFVLIPKTNQSRTSGMYCTKCIPEKKK